MCDFDSLYYHLKDELLRIYKEAEVPQPRIKIEDLQSAKICGLSNLAKLILYLEREGYLTVLNKDESFKRWEVQIEAGILDLMFGYG
ncbi:MAG: hypothetical protein KNN13_04075 [Hydrogenobacter thermophilus]|uniref:Uncharacterized protein n=1 Tax=Hydrogenobacter thermophilus (strain DSM 6534 / IAM 12695 / TK-6) TaxID=608538 RepID=D3DIJ9_HYDTT|nr:hypothetical protein [Hydrogenobacter thermophilus]ADO45577.1 hypothetical protein Hydth_1189 [Hydrogenobacter thermophilus TK-6]QWK20505.1 MAG: hypothetical protein KNN13_04075 [Hydrogenobacter thermophilus]BAI69651.1 hypothetical protein HTH_1197 [Hydrogenobacter thermophilus TK-6]